MESIDQKYLKGKYTPIIFFEIYLTFTVLLFVFGPWDWGIENPMILYLYLMGVQLFLFAGYKNGLINYKPTNGIEIPKKFIEISILLNILISIPLIYIRSGGNFSFIYLGFINPGLVYDLSRDANLPYNITDYVNIIISPLTWPLIPWMVYYWKQLAKNMKVAGVIGIFMGTVLPYVASGTNKGLFDILFILIGLVLLPYLSNLKNLKDLVSFKSLKFVTALLSIFLILSIYFANNIEQRLGGENYLEKVAVNSRANNAKVSDKFLESGLDPNIQGAVIALTSYISQGYYGCSLALKEDFVPTYGLGFSKFLSWLIGDLVLENDFQKHTYPRRVSDKTLWDADIVWSSIYPWFASDVTFLGTYIIIFLIGKLLAKSWISTITESDPWAITIFSLLCIMLFYFSANNQIFQTGTTFITFFVALIFWRINFKFCVNK